MPEGLQETLATFTKDKKFNRQGPLCVALVMTQQARKSGLPLDPGQLLTEGGGQVLGLGKGAVQSILTRHGITRVLASEGGRTSRGSSGNMREYVALLNQLHAKGAAELDAIEGSGLSAFTSFSPPNPLKSAWTPRAACARSSATCWARLKTVRKQCQASTTPAR